MRSRGTVIGLKTVRTAVEVVKRMKSGSPYAVVHVEKRHIGTSIKVFIAGATAADEEIGPMFEPRDQMSTQLQWFACDI